MKRTFFVLLAFCAVQAMAQNYTVEDAWRDAKIKELAQKSTVAQQRSQWFRDARLGMFIHWNMSSVVGGEISWSKQFYDDDGEHLLKNFRPTLIDSISKMREHTEWYDWFLPAVPKEVYDNLYKSFYPGMYNADSIVTTAQKAGIKYIVMVTKHHDGFCMWDSQYTDYDIMSTPFKRDIVGEMADACHRHGLKFCIYYSQRDWHHPEYSSATIATYNQYMRNQIRELLTKYAPVSGIFFDAMEWGKDPDVWEPEKMFKEIYSIAPDIIINNRCGVPGDYYTPEQRIGNIDMKNMWESCMTFTGFWSWHGFTSKVIPLEKCLNYLISCAGGNGNLLIDVGTMPTGQIDPREKSRLLGIGEWMKTNGEAIYKTQGGPIKPAKWGTCTRKGKDMYLLVNNWNEFPKHFPSFKFKIEAISVGNQTVEFKKEKDGITFEVPENMKDKYVTVIKMKTNKDLSQAELIDISVQ